MSDDTRALPHVVTALIEKRRELAGKIEGLQGQLKQAVVDLDNVESTLRLFAPEIDLRYRAKLKSTVCTRAVM